MLLVIDSVSAACSVALIGPEGEIVSSRHETVGRGHAERLVPMIAEVVGTSIPDNILVDCGPGSFTGLRVGLAAAQGLGIGWGTPVSGYSSMSLLAAMAADMVEGEGPIAIAMEGGHGELFVQDFARGPLRPLIDLRSLAPDAAAQAIDAFHIAGNGAARLVAARGVGEAIDLLPDARAARWLPADLATLPARPIYGRAPDAKVAAGKVVAS